MTHVRWDPRSRHWGNLVAGGSPWRLSVLHPPLTESVARIATAGHGCIEQRHALILIQRGLAHPIPSPHDSCANDLTVVIPVFNDPAGLRRALLSVSAFPAIVVDDGSTNEAAIAQVVRDLESKQCITLIRLEVNSGPATARNIGCARVRTPYVIFMDADCIATGEWPALAPQYLRDPTVAVLAPQVRAQFPGSATPEWIVDGLNMGPFPQLVKPGSHVGFVPSAALGMRTTLAREFAFREGQRIGEDVDLVWRLDQAGYLIRYEPTLVVEHRPRPSTSAWLRRVATYGTSAAPLAQRFADYPRPVLPTPWSAACAAALLTGQPAGAAAAFGASIALMARRLNGIRGARRAAWQISSNVLHSDLRNFSNLVRREWWPIGLVAAATSPWSRTSRRATALMIAPLIEDYLRDPRQTDPIRYLGARLAADLAYGLGVTASVVRARTIRPIWPRLKRSPTRLASGPPGNGP